MADSKLVGLIFLTFVLIACLFVIGSILGSCDIRENAVMREQSETFTTEMKYRQKQEIALSNRLKVAEEKVRKLEQQLLCREDEQARKIEEAKREQLDKLPVLIVDDKKPQKANRVKEERENE